MCGAMERASVINIGLQRSEGWGVGVGIGPTGGL